MVSYLSDVRLGALTVKLTLVPTLMSSKDTATMMNKLATDRLTEVVESVKTAKLYPERINLYERKGLGGTPND